MQLEYEIIKCAYVHLEEINNAITKPKRGRRCKPGTKHPIDKKTEKKIQRMCHK